MSDTETTPITEVDNSDFESYLDWVANELGNNFARRIKKSVPKLIENGIDTPDKFRDKFNKGGLEFPETEKVLRALRKFEKL